MGFYRGLKLPTDGLVSVYDPINVKSFRGESTTNIVPFPNPTVGRYNNPSFSGNIINTNIFYMGSPIWEATFIPQNESMIPRLGSTEGFGFFHTMGNRLFPDKEYMASVYFKTDYPLIKKTTQGFSNTYSNIRGWGYDTTTTTRYVEGDWIRLYTKYYRNIVVNSVSYVDRSITNTLSAIVNTTETTQVLITVTVQSNGTFSTSTDFGITTVGGTITSFSYFEGLLLASPTITSAGGISDLSLGTAAIINHGLDTMTWSKLSDVNPLYKNELPFRYYVLVNIPSTNGVDATIQFRLNFTGFYSSIIDSKYWKITFDVSSLQVNDVIKTYWCAPMIEENNRKHPTNFVIGSRGSTVSTGGGLLNLRTNNNHCEFVDNIIFDYNNKSILFNGSSDMITGTTNNFNITTGLTLSCWFNAKSTQGTFPRLIGVDGSWIIYLQSTQNYRMAFFGSSIDASFPNTTGYNDNKWHNVVVSYGGNGINCYVDGISHGTISKTGNLNSVGDTPFSIGGRVGEGRFFNGNISHIMVYNKPHNENEILEIYNTTKSRFGL